MAKNSENILILGLGGVGYYLARRLAHEGYAITAIETDREKLRRADAEVDIRLIRGDAMNFATWKEADAKSMDYLIAVTDNDAVNMMSSLIAHRLGIQRKIVRVRSLEIWERRAFLTPEDLHIDLVIRPEELTAQEMVRLIKICAGNVIFDIADSTMQVIGTDIGEESALARMQIKDISCRYDDFYFRVVSIARGIQTLIPTGDDEILPQDHVYILVRKRDVPRLMELVGVSRRRRHRVMVVGGGKIGSRVAQLLEGTQPVRIIERNERRAEALSFRLNKTEILHGDGSDADTLIQAGLLDMDTIITATEDNETNIMTSALAKHLIRSQEGGVVGTEGKTITLVKKMEYPVLAATMGSDIVLNKKSLAGNEIIKYIRRGKLLSVVHLHGFEAEVVELVAGKDAPITKKPLSNLDVMKGKIIIGGFCRKGKWEIAVGNTRIHPGDKVLAICTSSHLKDLQGLILA